jgi:AraC-like DNA-binding protein
MTTPAGHAPSAVPPWDYDVRDASAADRAAFWANALSRELMPDRFDRRRDVTHELSAMRVYRVGQLRIRELIGGPQDYERTAADVELLDPRILQVVLQMSGDVLLQQDGRATLLQAGHLALYDSSRPWSASVRTPFRSQVFMVPKHMLRVPDDELSLVTAAALAATSGLAGVVADFLRHVASVAPDLERSTTRSNLSANAADLVRTLVQDQLGHGRKPRTVAGALRQQAEAYIEAHLRDEDLGPEQVARSVAVSVRRLHQVFAETGNTVGRRIRTARLSAAQRDLADAEQSTVAVSAIAARYGFSSASAFSREFRTLTRRTPTEFRAKALADDDGERPRAPDPRWMNERLAMAADTAGPHEAPTASPSRRVPAG